VVDKKDTGAFNTFELSRLEGCCARSRLESIGRV